MKIIKEEQQKLRDLFLIKFYYLVLQIMDLYLSIII